MEAKSTANVVQKICPAAGNDDDDDDGKGVDQSAKESSTSIDSPLTDRPSTASSLTVDRRDASTRKSEDNDDDDEEEDSSVFCRPLRERRLPASFWQEPNVPKRTVERSACTVDAWREKCDCLNGTTCQLRAAQSGLPHPMQSRSSVGACCRPGGDVAYWGLPPYDLQHKLSAGLSPSTCGYQAPSYVKDCAGGGPLGGIDGLTKSLLPVPSIDYSGHYGPLTPFPWTAQCLRSCMSATGSPICLAGSYSYGSRSEEVDSSAAAVAAYLHWRAAEDSCKPDLMVDPALRTPGLNSPSVPCKGGVWRPLAKQAIVQRPKRYQPY